MQGPKPPSTVQRPSLRSDRTGCADITNIVAELSDSGAAARTRRVGGGSGAWGATRARFDPHCERLCGGRAVLARFGIKKGEGHLGNRHLAGGGWNQHGFENFGPPDLVILFLNARRRVGVKGA